MQPDDFYEQCPIGVCVLRRKRQKMDVLYVNPALRQMLGIPDKPVAGSLEDIWPSSEISAFAKKLKGASPPREYTLPVDDRTGHHERWALLTIRDGRYKDEDALILWATDVSSSKEAEAALREEIQRADASAQMKSNFLATMSHEIRTPMQSVYGLLELIGEEKPDVRIKTMVDIAKTSASGLLEILNDILDFAKMDAEKMELDLFEVPVRTLVRGINEAMAVKAHGSAVKLLDDITTDVPPVIIGDPKRLRQIIMNLTGNALKFTKEGTVTIRVRRGGQVVKQMSGQLVLRFEVVDTGIGMPDAVCKKLFQPFTQADSSTSRKFGGTGLGLSICKKLVELMGGQIGVTSEPGKGSVFWFEIPTEEVGTASPGIDLPKLDGISVLSVEDHPQGAKENMRALESMGAKVESCGTCAEALDLVKRRPFDVGVIDQGLPDGLGIDLIRDIMEVRPFMGTIMYTVRDDVGLQHSLNAMGIAYLSKPASRRGLGEAVKDAARKTFKSSASGPIRLLIAEDTASVRDILQRQLQKLGVEADFVENGAKALEALETGKYGIFFTDLHMPEIDGYELVEIIRQKEAEAQAMRKKDEVQTHLPVIVLTADVQMGQRQVYMSHGFDECLLKPVSIGHLQRLLMRWGLLEEGKSPAITEDESVETPIVPSKPSQPPALDIKKVKEQMGSLDEGTVEMLQMFIGMTEPLIMRLRSTLDNGDFNGLKEAAHSLKGAARSACCNVLGDVAAALQEDAEAKKPTCARLVAAAEREFERASAEIRALKRA